MQKSPFLPGWDARSRILPGSIVAGSTRQPGWQRPLWRPDYPVRRRHSARQLHCLSRSRCRSTDAISSNRSFRHQILSDGAAATASARSPRKPMTPIRSPWLQLPAPRIGATVAIDTTGPSLPRNISADTHVRPGYRIPGCCPLTEIPSPSAVASRCRNPATSQPAAPSPCRSIPSSGGSGCTACRKSSTASATSACKPTDAARRPLQPRRNPRATAR